MGKYGLKGFTKQSIHILKPWLEYDGGSYKSYAKVPAKALLEVAKHLPERNLEDRQNFSPTLKDFLHVAEICSEATFDVYITTEERADERVTVEGVRFPSDRKDVKSFLLDSCIIEPNITEKNDGIIRMWWD